MSQHDRYISPFSTRYSSDEMQYIFSDDNKFRTWRRLWVALARAEMEQGLTNITPDMVAELEAHVDDINYEVAIEREKLVRHDVMSHVYAYGQQCPKLFEQVPRRRCVCHCPAANFAPGHQDHPRLCGAG